MKILLTVFFVFYLLTKVTTNPLIECNFRTALQSVPPLTWYAQTMDQQGQSTIVTRFLHNKATIFSNQFAKCYLDTLDPVEIYNEIGILGLFFLANFIYVVSIKKNWPLIVLFLTIPFLTVFFDNSIVINYYYKTFSLIGFAFFLKRMK